MDERPPVGPGGDVSFSELEVPAEGREALLAAFRGYLASDAFARSSERIPRGPAGPRRTALQRFEVVAW